MGDIGDVCEKKRKEKVRDMVGVASCWEKWVNGVNFLQYCLMTYQHAQSGEGALLISLIYQPT